MAALAEPVRVSPFIKFCRWGFLIAGIMYGASRYESLLKKQTAIRDAFEKTRPERQAREKAERERLLAEELEMLSSATGASFK